MNDSLSIRTLEAAAAKTCSGFRLGVAFVLCIWPVYLPACEATPYLTSTAIDLVAILPPPPAPTSTAQEDDITAVLAVQSESSADRTARAIKDDRGGLQNFAEGILGPAFKAENAPKAFALIEEAVREGNGFSEIAKRQWGRERPFQVASADRCLTPIPQNAAYPSGHTLSDYEMAILLGAMVPEKRAALFERAADDGRSRIIVGVHYPTDVEAGRVAGTAIAALLMRSPRFEQDFATAAAELRRAVPP